MAFSIYVQGSGSAGVSLSMCENNGYLDISTRLVQT